jgi:hypothetical protein
LAKINIRCYKDKSNDFRALWFEILEQREIANELGKIDLRWS